jgi:hypothetical protein
MYMSQKYFKEALHVYSQFLSYKKDLNEKYSEAERSGNYNRGYLDRLKSENADKMAKYQNTTQNRMTEIRNDYMRELDARDYLSGLGLPDHLLKVLNSPIVLTPRDYSRLAQRNKDSNTALRCLRDHASKNGFTLECYHSTDEKLEKFDTLVDRLTKSMWDYESIPYYTSADEAREDGGKLAAEATKLSFECYPTPKTLEEMISRDTQKVLADRNEPSADLGKAFLEGFGATVQDADGSILTEAEQLDASIHSLFDGRGGVVSPADVNYIRTDSDYQTLREQNPINDSDLSRMRDAVSSAIHERAAALSRGQSVDDANGCALDAYTAVMNA